MGALTVVVGGQYGSEGKGAAVGWLTKNDPAQVACVRVAGPNAGHTVIGRSPDDGSEGYEWRLRSVPVAAVTRPDALLYIAAGSEIDLTVLWTELAHLDKAGYAASERLMVDEQATILTYDHIEAETGAGLTARIGSTGKGIGAARAARLMRTALTAGEYAADSDYWNDVRIGDTVTSIERCMAHGGSVYIEGTQGYGLGLHAGHYPQCTSSDCRAIDFLSMAGISPWAPEVDTFEVVVAARPYPIRVAGNSGPMKGETTWEALGLQPELTTVTRKVRRVGAWDGDLVRRAVHANGGHPTAQVALTMADHVWSDLAGQDGTIKRRDLDSSIEQWLEDIEHQVNTKITLLGTGPATMIGLI